MKIPVSWLKEYLDTSASTAQIAETLTQIGLEVEALEDHAQKLKDFIVAEIQEAAPHPNASKLQVCKVFDGSETRQIVCGAANARAGLKVVLAREGVFIPGSGITIKKTKIRDVESNGMLCSAEELGLGESSEGIIELPADAKPGSPAAAALGANDAIIEIAITPNRADCFGIYGVARDLAAAGVGKLSTLSTPPIPNPQSPIPVALATPHCPHFIAIKISGVKNAASPEGLQRKLTLAGLKPISALVDVTNFMSQAFARPLHVFDAAKVQGGITVRAGKPGEKFLALDGKEYTLTDGMTVVADDARALGLGGIMGGMESGCAEATTDVILEAAWFEPVNIASAGRKLEILSDARTRFERGVDPAFTKPGALMAAQMIVELCGGKIEGITEAGAAPNKTRTIAFDAKRVETLGGVKVEAAECKNILSALGFTGNVNPPSWRADVEGEADLVEEILRIKGYASVPPVALPKPANIEQATPPSRENIARRALVKCGLLECRSYKFISEPLAKTFGGGDASLKLVNPISADLSDMRPSLLPGLLVAAVANMNRGANAVALCEVGASFTPAAQKSAAASLRAGTLNESQYNAQSMSQAERTPDVMDAKADAFAVLESLGVNTANLTITRDVPAWYHPSRSGALTLGGKIVLGHFGELHPGIAKKHDLPGRVAIMELFLDAIPESRAKGKAKPKLTLSAFQAVTRDFAFVLPANVSAAEVLRAARAVDKSLIRSAEVFDVYAGEKMEGGKKSLAFSITLQADDRTLTDAEIQAVADKVIAEVSKACGGVLRA